MLAVAKRRQAASPTTLPLMPASATNALVEGSSTDEDLFRDVSDTVSDGSYAPSSPWFSLVH